VEQVKGIQRADQQSKQQWWDYCDTHLGGVKDPNRHDEIALGEFLAAHGSGQLATLTSPGPTRVPPPQRRPATPAVSNTYPQQQSWGYGAVGGGGMGGGMDEFVKMGQRKSPQWKAAWQAYCGLYGTGYNDPAKYDEAFIQGFLEYIGSVAMADLESRAAEQGQTLENLSNRGPPGQKRPFASQGYAQPPPAKRAAAVGGGGKGPWAGVAAPDGDAEKADLVEKVKALQRTGPEAKNSWWTFCDEAMQGVKDPNRHDKTSLQRFLQGYDQM